MLIGYARVSTDDQTLDAQLDALKLAGAERVFKEKKTGKNRDRAELAKLLDQLRTDDVVIVTKYDRLARSLRDLIEDEIYAVSNTVNGFTFDVYELRYGLNKLSWNE